MWHSVELLLWLRCTSPLDPLEGVSDPTQSNVHGLRPSSTIVGLCAVTTARRASDVEAYDGGCTASIGQQSVRDPCLAGSQLSLRALCRHTRWDSHTNNWQALASAGCLATRLATWGTGTHRITWIPHFRSSDAACASLEPLPTVPSCVLTHPVW